MGANKTPKPSPTPNPTKKLFIAASWEVAATDCVRPLACREDARRGEKFAASFPQAATHDGEELFCYTRLPNDCRLRHRPRDSAISRSLSRTGPCWALPPATTRAGGARLVAFIHRTGNLPWRNHRRGRCRLR